MTIHSDRETWLDPARRVSRAHAGAMAGTEAFDTMIKRVLFFAKMAIVVAFVFVAGFCALNFQGDIPISELKAKYAVPESKFIDVDGISVHYRDEGASGDAVPIVLLHGIGSNLRAWDGWAESIKNSRRVIRLDLPGFGLTGKNPAGNYSVEEYSRLVHDFLGALGISKSSVVGNSMGGRIAWEYALAYPAEVEKLVLIDATGFPSHKRPPLPMVLASTPVLDKLLLYVTPKYLVEKSLHEVYEDDSKVTQALIDQYYEMTCGEGNRSAFVARVKTPDNGHYLRIGEIRVPVLILWGRRDKWVPVGDAYKFNRALRDSRLIVYDDLGHMPMADRPNETARDALGFL